LKSIRDRFHSHSRARRGEVWLISPFHKSLNSRNRKLSYGEIDTFEISIIYDFWLSASLKWSQSIKWTENSSIVAHKKKKKLPSIKITFINISTACCDFKWQNVLSFLLLILNMWIIIYDGSQFAVTGFDIVHVTIVKN
jgi:hypothetical protein